MRLIDVDNVMKVLEIMEKQYRDYVEYEELITEDEEWYKGKINGIVQVKSMLTDSEIIPTSYDVDKVVEKLEELTELAYKRMIDTPSYSPCYERYSAQYSARKEFLEIVKGGGAE